MKRGVVAMVAVGTLLLGAPWKCERYFNWKIETGSRSGTYYQMGGDLAQWVAPKACINLTPEVTHGSVENVWRLRKAPNVKLAIVQADVMAYFKKLADAGNLKAKDIVEKLRVVKPLYLEEVHFIARKDSPLVYVQDIRDSKIEIGPPESGTALTTAILYRELFHRDLPVDQIFQDPLKKALQKLREGKVDVVVVVGGQPLLGLEQLGKKGESFKFLRYDSHHPLQAKDYEITYISPTSYSWNREKVPTVGVRSYLVTFNYQGNAVVGLGRFGYQFHRQLPTLKREGHPKWREVSEELEPEKSLPFGWKYYLYSKVGYLFKEGERCTPPARRIGLCK
ncbi:MAG: TAXI family TRAP transporter solute-binding subunit [Campylobacterales bacterium]